MTTATDNLRDPLMFIPVPLASGQVWCDPATDELRDIASMKCVLGLVDGSTVDIDLDYVRGGWRAPHSA